MMGTEVQIIRNETGEPSGLERRHAWAALVLLRAARQTHAATSSLVPAPVRSLLEDEDAFLDADDDDAARTPIEVIERELEMAEEAIAAASDDPVRELARQTDLNEDETCVVSFLFSLAASPLCQALARRTDLPGLAERECSVGFLLGALFPAATGERLIALRRMFHPTGRLIAGEIVRIQHWRMEPTSEPNILTSNIELSTRILNRIHGDDISYARLSAFLSVDYPDVNLADVVLPPGIIDATTQAIGGWLAGHGAGDGLSMLFYGPSGTGKTLLAQAFAGQYGLPLVRLKNPAGLTGRGLYNQQYMWDSEDVVRYMLREARTLGGIAFFDECDDVFRADSVESRALLIELERNGGLAILATNSPRRLDPALDRRLALRLRFPPPDREARRRLWSLHLERSGVPTADVYPDALAGRFFFSGGYIRNAVRMAALARRDERPLAHADLIAAGERQCDHIGGGFASQVEAGSDVLPPCSDATRRAIEAVARAGRVAIQGEDPLRVRLIARSLDTLHHCARAIAGMAGCGVLITRAETIEHREETVVDLDSRCALPAPFDLTLRNLALALPADCSVALEHVAGCPTLDNALRRLMGGPALLMVLDATGCRPQPGDPCDLVLEIEAPEAVHIRDAWAGALTAAGVTAEEEELDRLAALGAADARFIESTIRRARWTAIAAETQLTAGLIVRVAEEGPPGEALFGGNVARPRSRGIFVRAEEECV